MSASSWFSRSLKFGMGPGPDRVASTMTSCGKPAMEGPFDPPASAPWQVEQLEEKRPAPVEASPSSSNMAAMREPSAPLHAGAKMDRARRKVEASAGERMPKRV